MAMPSGLLPHLKIASYVREIPGMASSTCAPGRISSAMSVMFRLCQGYRLLPIFGNSLSIAPPHQDWQL